MIMSGSEICALVININHPYPHHIYCFPEILGISHCVYVPELIAFYEPKNTWILLLWNRFTEKLTIQIRSWFYNTCFADPTTRAHDVILKVIQNQKMQMSFYESSFCLNNIWNGQHCPIREYESSHKFLKILLKNSCIFLLVLLESLNILPSCQFFSFIKSKSSNINV